MAKRSTACTMELALENFELIMPFRYQVLGDDFDESLMASSEVDQRFLGNIARRTEAEEPLLSSRLYQLLGLSILLSKKLVRARRLRKLDTTRDTKSLQLYHHIIWLSREGLVVLEKYVLPEASILPTLDVLAHKLLGSFYHIFVLFHNQPSIHQTVIPSFKGPQGKTVRVGDRASIRSSPDAAEGGPVRHPLPPGLSTNSNPKPAARFLLPAEDYIPKASRYFAESAALADALLTGSHPLRVSVKVEYAAYLYDCLHDGEGSRKLAAQSLREIYADTAGMDDDMFEETTKLVLTLDRMRLRGLNSATGSGKGSAGTPSTPRLPYATGTMPALSSHGSDQRIAV